MLETLALVVFVLLSLALIGLVLIQQGKGADMGAAFGSGASGTVFGAAGSGNFMTKLTGWVAAGFMIMSLVLATLAGRGASSGEEHVPDAVPVAVEEVAPLSDVPAVPGDAAGSAGLPVIPE